MVEIGLTDLPKSRGAMVPPGSYRPEHYEGRGRRTQLTLPRPSEISEKNVRA